MKIEHLAIIFILIILPIDIVLGLYLNAQIDTIRNQATYDSRLVNCVYDAMKIYESNSIIDTEKDIVTSKMKNIEASASTFLSSLQTSFGYSGYKASVMQEYVPAVVYTMYDGYYIYSKFNNTLSQKVIDPNIKNTYSDLETYEDVKSYVFYSCRYQRNNGDDFVITYSLDNYISIQGLIHGNYVSDSGYLIDGITNINNGWRFKYDVLDFTKDESTTYSNSEEYIYINGSYRLFKYVKINGTKYYLDKTNKEIFHFINGEIISQVKESENKARYDKYKNAIENNQSAFYYYKEAFEFTKRVRNNYADHTEIVDGETKTIVDSYGLNNLKSSDAVYWDSKANNGNGGLVNIKDYGNYLIFGGKEDDSENVTGNKKEVKIQYSNSAFNQHRKAVIRYTIETNLSAAIAGFSSFSEQSIEYALPKISEEDWETIENNVCIIGFLQGLDIGTKKYNGYAVCVNSLTSEFVDENSIYIIDDNEYHRANSTDIPQDKSLEGVFKLDFERHYITEKDGSGNETTSYYYPKLYVDGSGIHRLYSASYTSIVSQTAINTQFDDMYQYMETLGKSINYSYKNVTFIGKLKRAYYTALARERYGAYKINHDIKFDYYLVNY